MKMRSRYHLAFMASAAIALYVHIYYLSITGGYTMDLEMLHIVLLACLLWVNAHYYFAKVKKKTLRMLAFFFILSMSMYLGFSKGTSIRLIQLLTIVPIFVANVVIYSHAGWRAPDDDSG